MLQSHVRRQAAQDIDRHFQAVVGETELFLENKVASYNALVDLLIEQDKPLDALLYAERAKGRVLLDVLKGGKPDLARVLTPAEKEETHRLNRRISNINDRIKKEGTANSPSLNSLYEQLDTARLQFQSFQDSLYVTHPDLRIRIGHTAALTASDVKELTTDNDIAYLEYVAARDHVSLIVVTRDKSNGRSDVRAYPIAMQTEDLARIVNKFHDMLANRNPMYPIAAQELYSVLLKPAEKQLRSVATICIIPDGFLWNLPFQALMPAIDHFLIEDRALYYAPSLSVLRQMNQKERSKSANSTLLAFGNPVIGKDEQREQDLCPLPEAENEVRDIANTFGTKARRVFIGREATEMNFKALAPSYSVIHLATHGALDNRQPLYSHVLLTKTDDDLENDGLLEAREIMNMRLSADLAVLSACETANGKISPGEGVIGMSWAFFVAGTRSMVVSQWKVNSASTSSLLINFYRTLASSRSERTARKARALREAALSLMKTGRYHHPFYWAGFVLVGKSN